MPASGSTSMTDEVNVTNRTDTIGFISVAVPIIADPDIAEFVKDIESSIGWITEREWQIAKRGAGYVTPCRDVGFRPRPEFHARSNPR